MTLWDRFDHYAKTAVGLAERQATETQAPEVTAEHLLRGVIDQPDCLGAKLLVGCGICLDELRSNLGLLDTEITG